MAGKGRKSLMGESLEGFTNSTKSIAELDAVVNRLRKQGEKVSAQEVADIANQRIKNGQYKTKPSVFGQGIKAVLDYFSPTNPKQAPSQSSKIGSDEVRKNQIKDKELKKATTTKQTKYNGGSITKNRIGGNDYRKGGYVLNTVDNRKKKG